MIGEIERLGTAKRLSVPATPEERRVSAAIPANQMTETPQLQLTASALCATYKECV